MLGDGLSLSTNKLGTTTPTAPPSFVSSTKPSTGKPLDLVQGLAGNIPAGFLQCTQAAARLLTELKGLY